MTRPDRERVLRNLAVVSEAVRALPAETRDQIPDVPWAAIAGLRNVVHEYFRVDRDHDPSAVVAGWPPATSGCSCSRRVSSQACWPTPGEVALATPSRVVSDAIPTITTIATTAVPTIASMSPPFHAR